jgi:hypothetical protein
MKHPSLFAIWKYFLPRDVEINLKYFFQIVVKNLYGKNCYDLNDDEKAIARTESVKKMREMMKRMSHSFTENELLKIVGTKDSPYWESLPVKPPVAISIEGITLPLYAHHFKKTRG